MKNFSMGHAVNMAPTGIATFAKASICDDISSLEADIAVIGAPCDLGIQGRSGARLGPRGIRAQSTRFSYSPEGSYDPEKDDFYLSTKRWTINDCGDIDYIPGDLEGTFQNIESAVRIITEKGAMPVILGGDHSISIPVSRGLNQMGSFNVIHIDAHLDWTSNIGGQTLFNGSPCRQMANLPYVDKIAHLGVHGIGSSKKSDFEDARAHGDIILSPKEIRKMSISEIIDCLPAGKPYYVTIDIDALDYTLAAGTGSPMVGGLSYDEVRDLLEGIAEKERVIAFDMVEVSPSYDDPGGTTCYTAARIISDFMGFITKKEEKREFMK